MESGSELTLADRAWAPGLGESRSRVLDLLRSADGPSGVHEIAERAGLHPNTARFHLEGLVEAGLAARTTEAGGKPGRPRMVYRALPSAAATGRRSFRLLAEMLTTLVAVHVPQAGQAAAEAGRQWGAYLVERPAPFERLDEREAVMRLMDVLTEIGFDPELEPGDPPAAPQQDGNQDPEAPDGARVRLRHCPFREVAERHRDVVCSLHLGLMQGALAELRAPVAADSLDPFVEPSLCIAHMSIGRPRAA